MTNGISWYRATLRTLVVKIYTMRDIFFARHVKSMNVRSKSLQDQGIR